MGSKTSLESGPNARTMAGCRDGHAGTTLAWRKRYVCVDCIVGASHGASNFFLFCGSLPRFFWGSGVPKPVSDFFRVARVDFHLFIFLKFNNPRIVSKDCLLVIWESLSPSPHCANLDCMILWHIMLKIRTTKTTNDCNGVTVEIQFVY